MSNLYVRPRRKRRWGAIWLAGAILIGSGLAWHQGWLPEQALAGLEQSVVQRASLPVTNLPGLQPKPKQSVSVVMANANVIENPQSDAYTAVLYSNKEEGIPWPNVGRRTTIQTYTVESGDTLWSIAAKFELELDTLRWSNPELERNPDVLAAGTELRILPVNGVYHIYAEGETIESIAAQYGVAETDITDYPPNALYPPYDFKIGDGLIIPFGRKDLLPPQIPALSADFPLAWPAVGIVAGGFAPDHQAIDIAMPYGSTIYAADDGTVIYADWATDGYGYTLIIDHGDGWQTWYNHLKGTLIGSGSIVSRGTPIAESGSTGHSSAPHLHFELRIDGKRVDPLDYLPATPQ